MLRESIIRISDAVVSQYNKGDKMSLMYDYLTSYEFKNHIKDIADAFIDMQNDLESEKGNGGIVEKEKKAEPEGHFEPESYVWFS